MRVLIATVLLLTAPVVAQGTDPVPAGLTAEDRAGIRAAYRARGTIGQQAYLKASNTDYWDEFGYRVVLAGDTVVATAPYEDSSATGVNGNQGDNSASNAGAAYVFVRGGTSWSQQAYIKASNAEGYVSQTRWGDLFGFSAAIHGETLVIGALHEDSGATGVNGDQGDNSAPSSGAVYVFGRGGTSWSQQAYLKASNTDSSDYFGAAVAISGNTVVVGAPLERSAATGVNGDQSDNSLRNAGAAYVFVRSGTSWSQQAYLKASNADALDSFGSSVAISGDTVIVGARDEASAAPGVNGDQSDNSFWGAGAAYVFVRSGTSWSQQAYLKASNTDAEDDFGYCVAVSGDIAVVGARLEDSDARGVNGDQSDNSAQNAGAAYVFVRDGTSWSQQAYLKASDAGMRQFFGRSVSISNDDVVVGDQGNWGAGAAYVFGRRGTVWRQRALLEASNQEAADHFGFSVAISCDTVLAGAPGEDSSATGVNGDQGDNSTYTSGAAYVLTLCSSELYASETIRLGSPPNPCAFLPGVTSAPIVGLAWDPMLDHEHFAPCAVADFVGIDFDHGPLNIPTAFGTLLIWPPRAAQIHFALPGEPFAIPIPSDCSLVGASAWSQGGAFNAPGLELANGLDIVIGTF